MRWGPNGRKRGSGFSGLPRLVFFHSWYCHPIFCNLTMRMQTHGTGFNSRSTTLHRYGTQSKGYTGAKCWQIYEMTLCMPNNRMSRIYDIPGLAGSHGRRRNMRAFLMGSRMTLLGFCWLLLGIAWYSRQDVTALWFWALLCGVLKGRWIKGSHLLHCGEGLMEEISGASVSPFHLDPWVPFLFGFVFGCGCCLCFCFCLLVWSEVPRSFAIMLWVPACRN